MLKLSATDENGLTIVLGVTRDEVETASVDGVVADFRPGLRVAVVVRVGDTEEAILDSLREAGMEIGEVRNVDEPDAVQP